MDEKEVLEIVRQARGSNRLDLSNRGLVSLPDEVGELVDLQMLYLMNNQLAFLPKTIGQLKNLGGLYLDNNKLECIPAEIGQLANLQELYLCNNLLTEVPATLGDLTNLVTLRLEKNRLGSVPPDLGRLRNLHVLSLSDNWLTSIPDRLCHLANLQSLLLARNNLVSIPSALHRLARLEELDLSNNALKSVPMELGDLRMLRVLHLEDNLLVSPRPEVIEQGTEATLAYLRELARGKRRRYEAKLLILGDGGEGKTCLSRALRGEPFQHQRQTEGVEQQSWTFPHPRFPQDKDKNITLNIWDFQGQEIHHQTHKFFLTEKLLYLLVINGRRAFRLDRAEYWLDTIRARAKESQVILVATECESAVPSWPLDVLKDSYGDLFQGEHWFFQVGCETNKGIPELSSEIQRAAADMKVVGIEWPSTYKLAEETIREESNTSTRSHITRDTLYNIFRQSDISEVGFPAVARHMAALGLITEFPDSPDLADFIVLKPQWLTKAISHVMEDDQLAQDRGEITHRRMGEIWAKNNYLNLYANFHNCMKEFELCYDMEFNAGCLVPLWFGDVKPRIPWSDIAGAKERRIEYELNKRPPKGVMSLFIVKTHHMIAKTRAMPKGVYWQNGVFLRAGTGACTSEALCELHPDKSTLSIHVRAAFPQNMIEQLHAFATAVFGFFDGLRPERGYGCVKFEPEERQCPAVHPERQVLFALCHEPHEIPCGQGWHKVDPRRLVYGLSTFGEIAFTVEELKQELSRRPQWAQGIIRDLKDCLVWLDKMYTEVLAARASQNALPAEMRQQVELGMREYLRLHNELLDNRDFSAAPAIVSIAPVDKSAFDPRNWFEKNYILTPYCEWEGGIHRDYFSVSFKMPRDWWEKTAPKLALGIKVLSAGMQMALAGMPLAVGDSIYEAVRNEVEFMKELVKHLKLKGGAASDVTAETDALWSEREMLGGILDLRDLDREGEKRIARFRLTELLKSIAPANYGSGEWGALKRVRMPDNTFRWLCPKHTREYRK